MPDVCYHITVCNSFYSELCLVPTTYYSCLYLYSIEALQLFINMLVQHNYFVFTVTRIRIFSQASSSESEQDKTTCQTAMFSMLTSLNNSFNNNLHILFKMTNLNLMVVLQEIWDLQSRKVHKYLLPFYVNSSQSSTSQRP